MEHDVTHAKLVGQYALERTFADGAVKVVDLERELWGEMFEPLREPDEFAKVRVDPDAGTIVWPNGADSALSSSIASAAR